MAAFGYRPPGLQTSRPPGHQAFKIHSFLLSCLFLKFNLKLLAVPSCSWLQASKPPGHQASKMHTILFSCLFCRGWCICRIRSVCYPSPRRCGISSLASPFGLRNRNNSRDVEERCMKAAVIKWVPGWVGIETYSVCLSKLVVEANAVQTKLTLNPKP